MHSESSDVPIVLFVGGDPSLPASLLDCEPTTGRLMLETKYYCAQIECLHFSAPEHISAALMNAESPIAGLVIVAPAMAPLSFVDACKNAVAQWTLDVQVVLLLDRSSTDLVGWCIEEGFELIQMTPDEETIAEHVECDELWGVKRLVQVLENNSWPGCSIKADPTEGAAHRERLSHLFSGSTENADDFSSILSTSREPDPLLDDEEEEGDGSFEKLFANFQEMKVRAENLPSEERKKYAEQVTLAFWKAMGGDEEETVGLSDDETAGLNEEETVGLSDDETS